MSPQCSDCATSRRSVSLGRHARRLLRQLHLWIGLALCLPMVVVGLTGSILVYRNELAALLNPPPRLTCATGKARFRLGHRRDGPGADRQEIQTVSL